MRKDKVILQLKNNFPYILILMLGGYLTVKYFVRKLKLSFILTFRIW